MKFTDNPIMILLGVLALAVGAFTFFDPRMATITDERVLWAVLAVAVLIIFFVLLGKPGSPVGLILLAIFLGSLWVANYFKINFTYRDLILGALALGGGGFMLLGL
jgi:hypothetical protein